MSRRKWDERSRKDDLQRNVSSMGVAYFSKESRGDTMIFKYVKNVSREGRNKLFSR